LKLTKSQVLFFTLEILEERDWSKCVISGTHHYHMSNNVLSNITCTYEED